MSRPARYVALAIGTLILATLGYLFLTTFDPAPASAPAPAPSASPVEEPSSAPEPEPVPSVPTLSGDSPEAQARQLYAEMGEPYPGREAVELSSLTYCGYLDGGVALGAAWREQVQYVGVDPEQATLEALVAIPAYCPEHTDELNDWLESMGELADLLEE
jgi:hypothetical protein